MKLTGIQSAAEQFPVGMLPIRRGLAQCQVKSVWSEQGAERPARIGPVTGSAIG